MSENGRKRGQAPFNSYDEWGRAVTRSIDSGNSQTATLDALGRVTSVVNALCPGSTSFGYSYFDPTHPTNRIGSIAYPNGQSEEKGDRHLYGQGFLAS